MNSHIVHEILILKSNCIDTSMYFLHRNIHLSHIDVFAKQISCHLESYIVWDGNNIRLDKNKFHINSNGTEALYKINQLSNIL